MNLPKQISIAGHIVRIIYKKKLFLNGNVCYGIYDDTKHIIYIAMGMDRTRKMEVFLHEIIHAIEFIHGLKLSEKAVNLLGLELFATLRNNHLNFLETKRVVK